MRFSKVRIEALAVALPEEIISSAAIEEQLRPLYERLNLPFGRLELMTGIRERRVWSDATRPSDIYIRNSPSSSFYLYSAVY